MNNKIIKLQQGDYFKWKNLSREDKVKRNKQIAKQYLDKGPSIQNYYNALKAYFGGFNPKNPYLQTGEPIILPGTNPTKGVQTAAKAVRTLEDYLKTTKVAAPVLEGSSAARSAYATDRYLGGVMFENNLPEAASQIQGHGMAKASTLQENLARLRYILDNGLEKGKTFFTAPLKVSDARIGSALGTGGGKPYFDGHFLITGKPGQMINSVDDIGTIYINDAYENEEALKAAQKMKEYLTKTYPNKVFKLYSEGFKKGGSIKTANARKWKHEKGGEIKKAQYGAPLNLSTEDIQGGLQYIAQGLGKVWDIMNAPVVNTQSTTAYLPNGSQIEIPGIQGGAPEYLPGRFGRLASLKNRAWLEKSNPIVDEGSLQAAKDWVKMLKEQRGRIGGRPAGSKNVPKKAPVVEQPPVQKVETSYAQSGTSRERFLENRKMGISKRGRVSSNDKNARAMEASDARITNAGNSNLKKSQLQQVERNLHKYPKHEIERFQNKTLLNMYRKGRSEKDIQKATREFYKYLADNYGYFKDGGILKAQLGLGLTQFNDPENPNAVGGDIVNSYIRNQLMIPYLNKQKEDYEKWKLQMKQQANTQKSSLFDNLLNTGLSIGTDYLKFKLGI